MTRLLILTLLALCTSFSSYAQGTLNLKIKVLDTRGKTITNAEVLLRETSTKQVVKFRTNAQGLVQIKLNYGIKWNLFINGLDMERVIKVPEFGTGSQSMTQTYNHVRALRLKKQTLDRSKLTNTEQSFNKDFIAKKGYTYIQVQVVSRKRKPHSNKFVRIVNHKLKQSYTAKKTDLALLDSN